MPQQGRARTFNRRANRCKSGTTWKWGKRKGVAKSEESTVLRTVFTGDQRPELRASPAGGTVESKWSRGTEEVTIIGWRWASGGGEANAVRKRSAMMECEGLCSGE